MEFIWKTEGPTDLLALVSLGLPDGHSARCNPFGAGENPLSIAADGSPKEQLISELAGKTVYVVHDCDQAGQYGATVVERKEGRTRLGWAPAIAIYAAEVRNVVLPYEITESHGKDLRDWINDRLAVHYPQHNTEQPAARESKARAAVYAELLALAQSMPIIPNPDPGRALIAAAAAEDDCQEVDVEYDDETGTFISTPLEMADDPYKLARLNLKLYRDGQGRDLKFWNSCWYRYKDGRYTVMAEDYLKARITSFVRQEFDRVWETETQAYEDRKAAQIAAGTYNPDADKGPPTVRKVTVPLVRNVLEITKAECVLPASVTMPCWLEDRSQPHLLAMANGLLNLDELSNATDLKNLPGNLGNSLLKDLDANWFSTFSLDYDYDVEGKCPRWTAYIKTVMEGDQQRMDILQEWAGYLLTSTNDLQRFLCLEGEGGNGKTVFFAGLEAMLGADNVSHVPVENFGGRFDLGSTLGKAANICGDVGEIDTVAEGTLKQYTGGDSMFFDRKGIAPISARPTAKLMCAWNNRPRFKDRSSGLWRRMLLVPFNYKVPKESRVLGMDSRAWWEASGEVPGILNWAIAGLFRLRLNREFSASSICEAAIGGYREESNPALAFMLDYMERTEGPDAEWKLLLSHEIYKAYDQWTRKLGGYPLNSTHFFRELNKNFPHIEKKRSNGPGRPWGYTGIKFADSEIMEEKTPGLLFAGDEPSY